MSLLRNLIRPYFYTRYRFHRLTGTGAFRDGHVSYVQTGPRPQWNPLKRALWDAHVKQLQESSCSVATVVTCINAIGAMQNGNAGTASQTDILDRVTTGHWKQRMSNNGYRGRRGLPLQVLGQVIEESLRTYGLKSQAVEIVQTPKNVPRQSSVRTTLKKRLHDFDRYGSGLIVAHFDQGSLVPTLNIPHISPVGAFDSAAGRVTMLDVDPEQKRPYAVDFDTFYQGLSCDYHHVLEAYGYGSGGYVYIRVQ